MSTQQSHTPYWDWLEKSASPQVKRELRQMEQSKQSSFLSVATILRDSYGYEENKSVKCVVCEKLVKDCKCKGF